MKQREPKNQEESEENEHLGLIAKAKGNKWMILKILNKSKRKKKRKNKSKSKIKPQIILALY